MAANRKTCKGCKGFRYITIIPGGRAPGNKANTGGPFDPLQYGGLCDNLNGWVTIGNLDGLYDEKLNLSNLVSRAPNYRNFKQTLSP